MFWRWKKRFIDYFFLALHPVTNIACIYRWKFKKRECNIGRLTGTKSAKLRLLLEMNGMLDYDIHFQCKTLPTLWTMWKFCRVQHFPFSLIVATYLNIPHSQNGSNFRKTFDSVCEKFKAKNQISKTITSGSPKSVLITKHCLVCHHRKHLQLRQNEERTKNNKIKNYKKRYKILVENLRLSN